MSFFIKIKTIFFLYFFIVLSSCSVDNNNDLIRKGRLFVQIKDQDVKVILIEVCSLQMVIDGKATFFEYEHENCVDSDYLFVISYKNGVTIKKNLGYIPGGDTPVHYYMEVKDREVNIVKTVSQV